MNYTYYCKLRHLVDKFNKKEIIKELDKIKIIEKETINGLTDSQTEYKDYLNQLLKMGYFKRLFFMRKLKKSSKKVIKVVFFCHEFATFPSFISIYDEMNNDKRFECTLVYLPFYHASKEQDFEKEMTDYQNNGYNIIFYDKYDICDNSPDVAFYLKAYDSVPTNYYISETKYLIDKIIFIPYAMEIGCSLESMRYQFQLPLHDCAWRCISYSKKHYNNACKYSHNNGSNYWPIGHPRMDLSKYDFSNNTLYLNIKKKAKNRMVFMYNPHFTIDDGDTWGTFKKFGMSILDYFEQHPDLFLIYRPHPFLKKTLENEYKNNDGFWKKYNHYLKDVNNIYYDDSANYLISMRLSDVLISDANSFIPEFLLYQKPVIYTKKENTSGLNCKQIENMTYISTSIDEITKNIQRLVVKKDIKNKTRLKNIKEFFYYNEKNTVAKQIIDGIIDSMEVLK